MSRYARLKVAMVSVAYCLLSPDFDECMHLSSEVCVGAEKCENTDGGYVCHCSAGYVWNDTSCKGKCKSHFSYIHNPMTHLGFLPHLLLHGVQMLMNVVWGCSMTAVQWQSVSILLVATTANANRDI